MSVLPQSAGAAPDRSKIGMEDGTGRRPGLRLGKRPVTPNPRARNPPVTAPWPRPLPTEREEVAGKPVELAAEIGEVTFRLARVVLRFGFGGGRYRCERRAGEVEAAGWGPRRFSEQAADSNGHRLEVVLGYPPMRECSAAIGTTIRTGGKPGLEGGSKQDLASRLLYGWFKRSLRPFASGSSGGPVPLGTALHALR